MSAQGFYKENGSTRPITPPSGVDKKQFKEGSVSGTGIGGPRREYSQAVPISVLAHAKSQTGYLNSLKKRLNEFSAGGKARKTEKKHEKAEREKEADKNLETANAFFERQEAIRKGKNPPPINIKVDVNTDKETIPRNRTPSEEARIKQQKENEIKKEKSVIDRINNPPQPSEPSSPAFGLPENTKTVTVSGPPESGNPASPYMNPIEAASTAEKTGRFVAGEQPKQKSKISITELQLLRYPASG